jgi:hypothetical protein
MFNLAIDGRAYPVDFQIISLSVKVKSKAIPLQAMEEYGGGGDEV